MCCVIHIFTLCICIAVCNYINVETASPFNKANKRETFLLHCVAAMLN